MSFFERFRGQSRPTQEVATSPELEVAQDKFRASLADMENLDLVREKAGLEAELEMEDIKPLVQKDSQLVERVTRRIQEIDAIMERARNEAIQRT